MSKKYDLSKKSDMRRFEKDLEKEVMDVAKKSISKSGLEIECPHCGKTIHVQLGDNICEHCSNQVVVKF